MGDGTNTGKEKPTRENCVGRKFRFKSAKDQSTIGIIVAVHSADIDFAYWSAPGYGVNGVGLDNVEFVPQDTPLSDARGELHGFPWKIEIELNGALPSKERRKIEIDREMRELKRKMKTCREAKKALDIELKATTEKT